MQPRAAEMSGLVDKVDGPSFNVSIGMLLWALENKNDLEIEHKKDSKLHISGDLTKQGIEIVKEWFGKFLP